jgi:hypothetical protein
MKQKCISLILTLSLLLPMGIALSHSFHDHDTISCHAKTESHIHAEKSACDQLHFFNHTLNFNGPEEMQFNPEIYFNKASFGLSGQMTSTFCLTELDRGPPFINVC